ncbi:MAG TPA: hypothetical protein PLR13_09770 [Smithella sp.]|nr:hypothetical protein [Smithella sp.]
MEQSTAKQIEYLIDQLYGKIMPESFDQWHDDVRDVIKIFSRKDRIRDFVDSFEAVKRAIAKEPMENDEKKKKLAKLTRLIALLKSSEPDFLLESLQRKGFAIAKTDSELRGSIENSIFRILQQIRLGKKAAVCGLFMQIFSARGKAMPQELVDALKEEWDINQYRAFMYAFLSNFTGREEYND